MLNFKEFLLNEDFENYVSNGMVTLYRFGRDKGPTNIIDPKYFGQNYYTRKDKEASDVPRTFFYLDPRKDREFFTHNKTLYKVVMPANQIYDILKDPEDIKEKVRNSSGNIDFHELLTLLSKSKYYGMYYTPDRMEIVTLFRPVQGEKVDVTTLPQSTV